MNHGHHIETVLVYICTQSCSIPITISHHYCTYPLPFLFPKPPDSLLCICDIIQVLYVVCISALSLTLAFYDIAACGGGA